MKLRLSLYLAAISAVLVVAVPSHTAKRPRYGGTLRVEIGATVTSLDPPTAGADPADAKGKMEYLLARRGAVRFACRNGKPGSERCLPPMNIIAKAGLLWIPLKFRWGGRRTTGCWTWSSTRRTSRRFPRSRRARQRTTACG